ncbi:MAG: AAA family ATPase, partial [Syntrophomonas sp.]
MRILSVRFKNLNSLVGIWSIDFTHAAYTSDGIFAITGPTGSGKTTILDAICLALYGRTPRLNRVTKSTNELMSRLTGECLAEVCFETQAGRFRCQWSQHRARNKANGELQTPRHELCHADSGDIIESRLREVVEKIEIITGMDYERFTRSMLLAQGGFAVFLQAPSNERAPILEQITGTEIYSRISMKIHERRAEEAKKLEKLKDDAAGIRLLDDEARKELGSNLEAKLTLEPQLIDARDTASKAFHWLEDITRLERDLNNQEEKKALVEQRVELFQPDLQKLDKARRARELEVDYAKISNKRDDQTRELDDLAVNLEKLPAAEEAIRNMAAYHDSAQDALAAAQLKQKQEMLIIKAVREVDINIEHKRKQVEDAQKGVQEAEKVFSDTQNSIIDLEISMQESRRQLDDIQQYLDDNSVDSGLIENLAAVKHIFQTLKDTNAQYNEMLGIMASDTGLVQEFEKMRDGLDAKYNEVLIQTRDAAEKHRSMAEAIKTLLEDREPEDLYRELDSLKERYNLLEQLQQSQRKMGEARESLRETGV